MQYLLGFLTIVIHAGENNTKRYADLISRGQQTFLHGIQHVIVHGGTGPGTLRNHSLPLSDPRSYVETTDAALLQDAPVYGDIVPSTAPGIIVSSPDNPGCEIQKSRFGKWRKRNCRGAIETPSMTMQYPGAHRTLVGVLAANDTFPDTAWTVVMDDDNMLRNPSELAQYLLNFNPDTPFFLAGRIGPSRARPSCEVSSNPLFPRQKWGCCYSNKRPCTVPTAVLDGPQAVHRYNQTVKTMKPPEICGSLSASCCRSAPWPEGAHLGFPYRAHPEGTYRPHFFHIWPYGGAGYAISRGMLRVLGREYWRDCLQRLQCGNADSRLATCIFNKGFTFTHACIKRSYPIGKCKPGEVSLPGIRHHIYPILERKCVETLIEKNVTSDVSEIRIVCLDPEAPIPHADDSKAWQKFRKLPFAGAKAKGYYATG